MVDRGYPHIQTSLSLVMLCIAAVKSKTLCGCVFGKHHISIKCILDAQFIFHPRTTEASSQNVLRLFSKHKAVSSELILQTKQLLRSATLV